MAGVVIRLQAVLSKNAESPEVDKRMLSRASTMCETMLAVIEDAEKRQVNEPAVKEWMEGIKHLCYNLIDLLEELNLQASKVRFLGHPLSCFNPLQPCMGRSKMEGIIYKFEDLLSRTDSLKLRRIPIQEGNYWDVSARLPLTSLVHEADIHGRDDERRILISKLLDEDDEAGDIQFISLVGTPGVGKSALARLVYSSYEVANSFDGRAWVDVSDEFSPKWIAMGIIKNLISHAVKDVEMEALELIFRQITKGKKCLFVLDDVRNEYLVPWLYLKLFNFCGAGSKFLVTTRNERVACIEESTSAYIMRLSGVSDQVCWSIIKDRAFDHSIDESHIEMIFNEVGRDIVKKCDGVPLITKSLGGIMRYKKSIQQWQEVLRSDVWDLEGVTPLRSSLMLSYSMMSSELRQCLLYCSIFPKNHSIDVDKLIKLWMAQGFVASDQDEMEREGWRCIKQLLDRSIFQEFKKDGNGNFKCRLEGEMRDFIQLLVQNECHIILVDDEKASGKNNIPSKPRHCSINNVAQASLPKSIAYAKKLHTLMISSEHSSVDPTNLASLLSHMRRVRALDLSSCSIKELTSKVGGLLHLRYLDLSFNHDLKKLPQVICNLFNLQTLNLNGCDSLRKLPKGIGKLIKLQHLEILWTTSLSYLPKGIASLTTLRTLNRFFGNSGAGSRACNIGDLENLNYIQGHITIDGLGGEIDVSDAAKASLKNKKDLLGLELWFSVVGSESNDEDVLEALEAPPKLQGLGIFYYRGESFPNWMIALEKLTHLMLADCNKCNILPSLGKLPSLESLKIKNMSNVKKVGSEFLGIGLKNADGGEEGSSSMVAFPKLQKLCFQKLDDWEEWTGINDNGERANIMPFLFSLSIINCPKLGAVPDYIKVKENLSRDIKNCPFLEETQDQ